MDSLQGKRLVSFIFYIRVNQLEVRLDNSIGKDEAELHNPEDMKKVRDSLKRFFPQGKVTWAFSHLALLDNRENYRRIRELAKEYLEELGDEVTYLPCAYFSNVYNTTEEINEILVQGIGLIKSIFNHKPESVIAGFLAAPNQQFLAQELDIHVCQGQIWSQFAVDNGDGDGGVAYPYYPSREHFLKPAQGAADKIDCVCFDGWTVDFIAATLTGCGKTHNSRLGFGPIETLHNLGPKTGLDEQMKTIEVHFEKGVEDNGFGFVDAIWELSLFGGERPAVKIEWFASLLEAIKKKYPDAYLTTLSEIGFAWMKENPDNSRWNYHFIQKGSGIFCSDANKTVEWFMNKDFRLGFMTESESKEKLVIDYTDYNRQAAEPKAGERNWSLLGLINQKNTRAQDKPLPFTSLPKNTQNKITKKIPILL